MYINDIDIIYFNIQITFIVRRTHLKNTTCKCLTK